MKKILTLVLLACFAAMFMSCDKDPAATSDELSYTPSPIFNASELTDILEEPLELSNGIWTLQCIEIEDDGSGLSDIRDKFQVDTTGPAVSYITMKQILFYQMDEDDTEESIRGHHGDGWEYIFKDGKYLATFDSEKTGKLHEDYENNTTEENYTEIKLNIDYINYLVRQGDATIKTKNESNKYYVEITDPNGNLIKYYLVRVGNAVVM